jgi:catechol 2,3-dioxygenase-like lactoylglutathione lyase family enzyme
METQGLQRGRLIDHVQLVVKNLAASRRFYEAVFEMLGVPIGGMTDDYFWADELFISSTDSPAAQGKLTGRHHLAFQAADRVMVDAFYKAALQKGWNRQRAPGQAVLPPRLLRSVRAGS